MRILILILSEVLLTLYIKAQTYSPVSVFSDHAGGITVMTRDTQKKYLIAGDDKGKIYFHDLKDGTQLNSIDAHQASVSHLQFNSNGKLLISSTSDGEIKIYDFEKGKIIQGIYSPDYTGINFVLFSIADGFIYFNGNNRLYKTRSDLTQKVNQVFNEADTIFDAVITNDRSSLIYSVGNTLKVLNTRSDIVRQEFNTGPSKIKKIALVKDSLIATWSADGTIFIWKYNLGQIDSKPVFFLKAGNPSPMIFSDDSKLMATGNIGNWARLWKPFDRIISQELFRHSGTVTSCSFGQDDSHLFTGSLDKSIILWQKDAAPESVLKIAAKKDSVKSNIEIKKDLSNEVNINSENIPTIISGRKVISDQTIPVNSSHLKIYVYDNSYIDGDTMSLFFNGKWILDHYGVVRKKEEVNLDLVPNSNNYLVLFANNLGKSPPNTAAIEFDDGQSKRVFRLSSDLKTCSAINFFYKK